MVNKIFPSFSEAVHDIPDQAVIMMDGFGGAGGMPQHLILALRDHGAQNLTVISNTGGLAGFGSIAGQLSITHSTLIESRQVRKVICSFPVSRSPSNPNHLEIAYQRGEVDVEVVPQGTLAERIRAGGAGIVAFYTPTGVGTYVANGKEVRNFDGREYLMEYALVADYAFIRASRADHFGNLVYRGTSRSFNQLMAAAAKITIVEVDDIVPLGYLDPELIATPGLYVDRVVKRQSYG